MITQSGYPSFTYSLLSTTSLNFSDRPHIHRIKEVVKVDIQFLILKMKSKSK